MLFCRPEALGVVSGCMFLITLFLFIPVPFGTSIFNSANFPHDKVSHGIIFEKHRYNKIKLNDGNITSNQKFLVTFLFDILLY